MSGISNTASLDEGLALRALEALERDPTLSQRALSRELGVSLGKTHYCLRALIDKGLVKLSNFQHSPRKLRYVYLLTPQGIEEKTRITFTFLRRKEAEYQALQAEIAELRARVGAVPSGGAE
ncbi:MarR family EPS-associated transcriptional regulator [Spiribacter vilamensis]|uniref:AsnC family transcriptional regulator n=1 Tax=Spiribacter vilamensis TaxID=531306 RepID=A0A4Q8D2P1_9GAMM|nr:MarR family EPS-associated transcriptional regulator [Spiribacter vilamensis]RZU99587.1 AsnC family transcriptional regulator [Spiribacter vilamensis]TVO61446.1 MarR family EPS-associated transcriptional regulator [Spiribacter vilamensis]